MRCPSCRSEIAVEDVHMGEGAALCRGCGGLKRLSDVLATPAALEPASASEPPAGCRVDDLGGRTEYVVSMRSVSGAAGALVAAVMWNGITGIFVALASAGLWPHVFGPLPAWFPAPSGSGMGLGMAIFLWLFLVPFMAFGAAMVWGVLLGLFGSLRVRVEEGAGTVRTGVGALAVTRRFDPRAVSSVKLGETSYRVNDQTRRLIVVEADKTVKFGAHLREDQRTWLASAMADRLLKAA